MPREQAFEPIAIVGRACVLPGALTPEELWANIVEGRDLISPAPEGHWGIDPKSVLSTPGVSEIETACSDRGGYVSGFDDAFDPEGFAIPTEQIEPLDPMVKWLLYCGRAALVDAGLGETRLGDTGVILGNLSYPTRGLAEFAQQTWLSEAVDFDARQAAINRFNSGYPVHLLADALGLDGDAFALDAACASSLYAIKLACDRLQDRAADIMLAGAVNRADDLFLHIGFTALQALSPSGRSRPFDSQADGLLPAEGAAIVVLKRLADAVRDGEKIHGVIRGIGLSNDGNQRGFLAPDAPGQVRAMLAAYAISGLTPEDISYVECHATGTPVGDGIEIDSMAEVFSAHSGLPIGSLKSNLGHLITASGGAGLLKVLAAMEAKTLPPTLHAENPIDAFEGTPFRPQRGAEPWVCDGPRIAAINNFGFGGNNAHLIVEEFDEAAPPFVRVQKTKERPPVAICGIGVLAGANRGIEAFVKALTDPENAPTRTAAEMIELPFKGLRFPPNDLLLSLPLQPMIIEVALEAVSQVGQLPGDRTGVLVGMGCDPEIARYGLRWRLSEILQGNGITFDADRLATAKDGLAPELTAAGVIGSMPNIPANRLNAQFDWQAFGFTVSSEELSGLVALQLAARALAAGELDAALVGAVDLSLEPVHMAAAEVLFPADRRRPGDAAVALVLKRLEDARRDGDSIYAILADDGERADGGRTLSLDPSVGESLVTRLFGHAHAASGLLHVAAAALSLGLDDNEKEEPEPSAGRIGRVSVTSFSGRKATISLSPGDVDRPTLRKRLKQQRRQTEPRPGGQRTLRLPAHFPPVRLPRFGPTEDDTAAIAVGQKMPEAPELPPIALLAPVPPADPPVVAMATTAVAESAATVPRAPGPTLPAGAVGRVLERTSALHRDYIDRQSGLYREFLAFQEQSWRNFTDSGGLPVPLPEPEFFSEPDAPKDAATPEGPSLSRADLERLAGGKISDVLGPLFKQQDTYSRQVRMPEPPLLLADRVTGIAGEAGSMGRGTIWTETDVPADAWYLHCGHMPPGIVIESGQADLLLISWLGIDFINKGERIYRLLGCELTFHEGGLPKPGDTLRYEIHVDGHAKTGDVRLFFFHYDCWIGDRALLSVRNGQAGFFSDEELLNSGGILWEAEDDEPAPDSRFDPPPRCTMKRAFDRDAVSAFVGGDAYRCFGEGFEMAATHQRTPTISGGRMQLIETVPEFDPGGGPWQRGYLRAETDVPVDCWFYDGHFKNDPCMPGTLMADAALQVLSFAMAGMGFTIDRDGWRFEPMTGEPFKFICRGQVIPDRPHRLTYEIYIEEVIDGDTPTVYAALLCSSDGFKVFQCRRFGLRLVPDWPLTTRSALIPDDEKPRTVGPDSDVRGDFAALLACAWGAPSAAFGSMYRPYDGARRVPRLPGPPYHCISRIVEVDCPPGEPAESGGLVAEYDVPPDAWYFKDNGHAVMPFSVLMEVLLQPCGWFASYMGFAMADEDLAFRNLDGDETIPRVEVGPDAGCLTTRTTLSRFSRVGDMTIVFFRVECERGGTPVLSMNTSFGFFNADALANQVGLKTTDAERTRRDQPSDVFIDLRERPDRLFAGGARVAEGRLRMIDAVSGFWPEGGDAGLGRIRGLQEIDPGAWYFKAHFYQDPVQPGSLGLEALLQLLQCAMLLNGLEEGVKNPRFEAIALDEALIWKYRGQVMPTNTQVTTELELTRVERDDRGVLAVSRGGLWVDGLRIYEVENLAMRIVPGPAGPSGTISLDLESAPWLDDHRPNYSVPTLPMMVMVDYLAAAAAANDPGRTVVALEDVRVHRWVTVGETPVHLKTTVAPADSGGLAVSLVTAGGQDGGGDGANVVATARVVLADSYPPPPGPLAALENGAPAAGDPYETGELFHGPAFHIMSGLTRGDGGALFTLDGGGGAVPRGCLNPGLLDGVLHGFPHGRPEILFPDIEAGQVAYPHHIGRITFHGPPPGDGVVHAQVRADREASGGRRVVFHAQAAVDGRVWVDLTMTEILLPKGPLGIAAPEDRRAFLRDQTYVADMGLARFDGTATRLDAASVRASNWLPGALETVYGVSGETDAMTLAIAVKEHVAKRARVHPSRVTVAAGAGFCDSLPMTRFPVDVKEARGTVTVTDAGGPEPNADAIRDDWRRRLNSGPWPVEDVFLALVRRFVGRVVLEDPDATAAIKGRPTLFLGNHQTGIESLLFSLVGGTIGGRPIVTIAKHEHRETWLGRLIQICQEYPGMNLPRALMFFDRDNQASMIDLVSEVEKALEDEGLSLMIHAEGTRALHCRQPVRRISAVFLDLALAAGLPIVPVRFAGGLPVSAADGAARLEFPCGFGRQDIYLGRPIMPETLAAEPLGERRDRVLDALNGLGPDLMAEDPSPPDAEFAAGVARWTDEWNIAGPRGATLHAVASDPSTGPELTQLMDSIRGDGELPAGTPGADWLRRLSRWFTDGT